MGLWLMRDCLLWGIVKYSLFASGGQDAHPAEWILFVGLAFRPSLADGKILVLNNMFKLIFGGNF